MWIEVPMSAILDSQDPMVTSEPVESVGDREDSGISHMVCRMPVNAGIVRGVVSIDEGES
jgi:hypothetical protein